MFSIQENEPGLLHIFFVRKRNSEGKERPCRAFFMKLFFYAVLFSLRYQVRRFLNFSFQTSVFSICILSLFFLSACNSTGESASTEKKRRFVSTMPSYTEILFETGSGNEVVGVSDYCDMPEAARKITKIGNYYTPSAEKIYSLRPDAVFIPESSVYALGSELEKLRVKVVRIPPEKNIEDIFSTIRIISAETEKKSEGEALISSLKSFIPAEYKGRRKKVYIDIDSGLWTCGGLSYLSDMIRLAGGENVFADVQRNYFQVTWESVLKSEPDFILTVSGSFSDFSRRPLASELPAIKNKAVMEFDRSQITRPGPRVFPLIKEMAEILSSGENESSKKIQNRKTVTKRIA